MQISKGLVIGIVIALIATVYVVMFLPFEDGEYIWNPFDYARITEVDYKAQVARVV